MNSRQCSELGAEPTLPVATEHECVALWRRYRKIADADRCDLEVSACPTSIHKCWRLNTFVCGERGIELLIVLIARHGTGRSLPLC
jgi:hypothetical protein